MPVNGETAEKRRRDDGIRRKFPGNVCGEVAEINTDRGKCVIAQNGFW
jgi:hypothetical protein